MPRRAANAGKFRSLTYTSFNLPDSQSGVTGPGGTPQYLWQYDENHARIKEVRTITGGSNPGTRTVWYLHPNNQGGLAFEREEDSNPAGASNRHFLTAGGQVVGVLVSTGALPALTGTAPPLLASIALVKVEYWHKDQLGSLLATTDHTGALTQQYSYDPFGKRRFVNGSYDAAGTVVADWSPTSNAGTARGFTGHEQLDDIGLVNMNGRIFDATLGRFLQADPFIQDPGNLQNYNRYGYCFNNPLTCTDPSGLDFLSDINPFNVAKYLDPIGHYLAYRAAHTQLGYTIGSIAIGVVSSVYCGGAAAICNGAGQAAWAGFAGYSNGQALRIGLVSGATTEAFTVVGDATGSGTGHFEPGWNTAGHALVGCASSVAGGGSCRSGAVAAGFSAGVGNAIGGYNTDNRVIGTMESAMVGGVGSVLGGGTFASGSVTGAFGYLFNELLHQGSPDDAMRRSGYKETKYDDGTYCNIQSSNGTCGFPGEDAPASDTQAGASAGFTAVIGMGVAYDVGPVRSTNGSCAIMQNVCFVAGPIAGYSADLTVLNVSAGSPSNGWSIGFIEKFAVPVEGFSVAPGYGSDGLTLQAGRSFGAIGGWGAKLCVEGKVGSCGGN